MGKKRDLETLERDAYRDSYSDGIIDIFVGGSLLWIGVAWIWLPDLAGIAGVLPAVLVAAVLAARKRIMESRVGYVKWGAPRRRWERRNLGALFAAGLTILTIGVAAFLVVTRSSVDTDVPGGFLPGLPAWLLALVAVGLGFLMGAWRVFAYAAVLAGAGIVTGLVEANPGWPLLASGAVIATAGTVMLVRFLRHYPAMP